MLHVALRVMCDWVALDVRRTHATYEGHVQRMTTMHNARTHTLNVQVIKYHVHVIKCHVRCVSNKRVSNTTMPDE